MFHTCIRCYADLGTNETIETFPVGRRLAFDSAKGRLWVVCRKCERWNLTPIEERWEAIEDCERRFRGTKLRVSTDNIGMARVGDRLDLVRIGSPLLPEMAAWRYGDQFGRRRVQYALTGAAGVSIGALVAAGVGTGAILGGAAVLLPTWIIGTIAIGTRRTRVRVRVPAQPEPVLMQRHHLAHTFITNTGTDWVLSLTYHLGLRARRQEIGNGPALLSDPEYMVNLRGDDAMRAVARILPGLNSSGARARQVKAAAGLLEETPNAARLFMRFAPRTERWTERHVKFHVPDRQYLTRLDAPVRLALEMAANEENERRAMEGELAHLEMEWRDAEEIAQIADDMETELTSQRMEELKGQ